jgi:hypothetical protein
MPTDRQEVSAEFE